MKSLPSDISFERWVAYVFDHPVLDPRWWWNEGSEHYASWDEDADAARTLAYLTRLFRNPGFLRTQFSRAQIDQGLVYLVDPSCSNHMRVLTNVRLPWAVRAACLDAVNALYANLMAPVYGNDLGHTGIVNDPEKPVYACYMFWDVIPFSGKMGHPDQDHINACVLEVFRKTLDLRSEACLESVLHGLSHWHLYLPDECEAIAGDFLRRRHDVSGVLRKYAEQAAQGMVQ